MCVCMCISSFVLWPLAIAIGFYGLIEDTLFKVFGGSSKRFTMNGKLLAENVSMSEKAREREREKAHAMEMEMKK